MKTELRPAPHYLRKDDTVVEVWHGDRFIATITGFATGPGVVITSKYLTNSREGIVIDLAEPPQLRVTLRS